ncbi:MAG: pantetheine-phosphate adenylyltransferase [Clostridia bacterium]|nr:pantetheine-phosphate adenylyltransferase [Clostridia bacterium]
MKKTAIVPGSYDPITLGHVDIIERAADMFDEVWVAITVNGAKSGVFTPEERLEITKTAISHIQNAEAVIWCGLTSDLMAEKGAKYIVKGARNATDFDYENSLSEIMRKFAPGSETVILPARPEYFHVSSTYARELLKYGGDLSDIAAPKTAEIMRKIYNNK